MRIGFSIPLPGPFRLSGTVWRSKRRRRRGRTWHGTLPAGNGHRAWRCPHNHSRPDLARDCARREARRRHG
jgi:hypothetical protein